jgi:hypothetical protein
VDKTKPGAKAGASYWKYWGVVEFLINGYISAACCGVAHAVALKMHLLLSFIRASQSSQGSRQQVKLRKAA